MGRLTQRISHLRHQCFNGEFMSQPADYHLAVTECDEDRFRIGTETGREPINITVMTVWPHPWVPWPISLGQGKLLEEKALENAQVMVDQIAGQLGEQYQSTRTVGMGDPAYAILEQGQTLKPDLIVVGSHGRKGISRFLLG